MDHGTCFYPNFRSQILSILMISVLLISTVPSAYAQSNWLLQADAEGRTLVEDEDDGPDFDAELSLVVDWYHLDKERNVFTTRTTVENADHNNDTDGFSLVFLLDQQFRGGECNTRDPIFVDITMLESDLRSGVDTVLGTCAGIVVGITVATVLAPSGPAAPAAGLLAAKVVGGLAGATAGWLFNNVGADLDDLGKTKGRRLVPGNNNFFLTGTDGGALISIADFSTQSSNVQLECPGGRGAFSEPQPVDPATAVAGIFPAALDMLALSSQIDREGATGSHTEPSVIDLRRTTAETATSLAEVAAVYFVMQAREGFDGASAALPLLTAGRIHHAAGEYADAIEDYRESFRLAYTAIWNGNPGPAYAPADALTLFGPVRRAFPDTVQEVSGWVQGLTDFEVIDAVDVTGQGGGLDIRSFPGVARTGVILDGAVAGLVENDVLGLGRVSAGVVRAADADCPVSHLDEGSIGGGIFVDGQGPIMPFEPGGCAYGEVIETYQNIEGGGVPFGAGPDSDGIFTLELVLDDALEPDEQVLTVTAQIRNTSTNATRELTAPLTLVYSPEDRLFEDRFQ